MRKDYEFSSQRLIYRGIAESDAQLIVQWRSNPNNYQWFFRQQPITKEEHLSWFANYLGDASRYDFMVISTEGAPIGTVGIANIENGSCEISYMIGDPDARGKGYATEAVRAMCDLAFQELRLHTVEARILPENEASLAVAHSAGFIVEEVVARIHRDGGDM